MNWAGETVLIQWGYKPVTKVAIKWHQKSDGNWRGCDRTEDEDTYESNIVFRGPKSELDDLNTVLNDNREEFIGNFNSGEEIFGADVDHSGDVYITVTKYGKIRQVGYKDIFEQSMSVRNLDPVFKSVSPDFSKLRTANHTNTRETVFELSKRFTYDGEAFISDHIGQDGAEQGTFKARFTQTQQEMPAIRRYLTVTARANKIPFPSFGGIDEPFGPRAGTGPFDCRIIKWDDLGRKNYCDWDLDITFARELSNWNK